MASPYSNMDPSRPRFMIPFVSQYLQYVEPLGNLLPETTAIEEINRSQRLQMLPPVNMMPNMFSDSTFQPNPQVTGGPDTGPQQPLLQNNNPKRF